MTAKAALQLLGVLPNRNVRLPLVPADDALVDRTCATVLSERRTSWSDRPRKALHEPARTSTCPHPGPLAPEGLRVIPLGGLGEVGRNMTVFEYAGRLLIVDCGVLFPEDHHPGVDLILPDFDPIRDRLDEVEALVLTHGHEDHIGATPYLLRERPDIPLVGSKLTLALLESKLREHRLKETAQHEVTEGDTDPVRAVRAGVRRGQPLDPRRARGRDPHRRRHRAAHRRLQDGPAAARRPDHRPARVRPARRGGRRPVHGRLHQRRGARLHHVRGRHRARARPGLPPEHATSGSSSLASPPTCTACSRCMDAAVAHGRKVAYVGRSMVRNMAVARDLGYLDVPRGHAGRRQGARRLPAREDRADLDRVAGRAAVGAVADRAAQPQLRAHRGGRHRRARVLADPRQRERRLPSHQRAVPVGRQRRAQGQRAGARLGPRVGR